MNDDAQRGPLAGLIDDWKATLAELAAAEDTEHPDVTDVHGRAWTWSGRGDLYRHDDCLAWSLAAVQNPAAGLPSGILADNPNYTSLCGVCRRDWPTGS